MLKGAIIGFGNIAVRGHVLAYLSDEVLRSKVQIASVMDVVGQNRELLRQYFPEAKFYTDFLSMLENERLDFVDICTPPHTHADYIQRCATKGIHILCEKPLTETYAKASGLVKLVRESHIVFVPCHQYKYSPLWKTIHEFIASKKLGTATLAQFNVFRLHADSGTTAWSPDWRTKRNHSGGGILVDTGAHYFYLAQYFFGVPKRVFSVLRTLKHVDYDVEDTALVTLEYDQTLMQVNLTWAANQRANSLHIVGTEGSLFYNEKALLFSNSAGTQEIPMPDVSDKNQYVSWYAALIKEFVKRIEEQNTSDDFLCEAFNVMKMLDLSYKASEKNAMIDVG
ncbi:MAG: Gfo/Idh/MocA family oxidoreductase [Ignavibacteriae bacterium]|nr:Gfo/Idh/MocA family oxidoreductase [Ignavibacteriota bacterium]